MATLKGILLIIIEKIIIYWPGETVKCITSLTMLIKYK